MQQLFLIWKQAKSVHIIKFLTPVFYLNNHQSRKFFTPKFHRVLVFAFFLIFSFAGLFNGIAQISSLNNWSNVYHGTLTTAQSINYIVPTGSNNNRVLVVAIASSSTAAGLRIVTLAYGGQTITGSVGDMGTSSIQHSALYYFDELKLDGATNTTLSFTVSGGTTTMTDVFVVVFDGVDQTSPVISDSKNYNSGATSVDPFQFGTALNVNENNQAVEIISTVRTGNTTAQTISSYPTNWTSGSTEQIGSYDTDPNGGDQGIRNAVANRSVPTSNVTDVSSVNLSGGARASMTAISLKAYIPTITSFTPARACSGSGASIVITGTNFTGATAVTFNGQTVTYTVNSSTQITATLPAVATTGKISITTGGGNVQSTNDFIIKPLPVISTQPSATAICSGQVASLSVASSSSSPVYQWQSASSDGGPWSYINSVFVTNPVFFESDFSSLPATTNLYGNASIPVGNFLQLTEAINNQTGGFVIQNTPGANLTAFNANFDYRIWEGTGADGFSLSYAPDITNTPGNGNGGEGSGIIVKFDTYNNYVQTNRTQSQLRVHYIDSIWSNNYNDFDFRNSNFRNVNIYVDHNGYLSLSIGGTVLVSDLLLPGYVSADKTNWKFKFSGRTGSRNDVHQIDNLRIQYGENPVISVSPTVNTYYRAVVTSGECSVNSNSALVTVNPLPTATISSNNSICAEEDAVFSLSGTSGATVTYKINGGADQTLTLTGVSATITISAATSNQTLTLVSVYDGTCSKSLTGNSSTITVNPLPVVGSFN